MDAWRLWMSCALALLAVEGQSGLTIGGCEQGSVDVFEDTDPLFTCASSNQLQWKIYSDQEKELYSASCKGWRCTPLHDQFSLDISSFWSGTYTSRLVIKGITRESAHRLICIVSSTQAECALRVIGFTIGGCEHGSADVTNGTDPLFTCTTSLSNILTWTLYGDEEKKLFSGSCNRGVCGPSHNRFILLVDRSSSGFTSKLMIKEITKDSARRLVCTASSTQAECSIKIIENEQEKDSPSTNGKEGVIGGVVTAVIVIAIIGTIIAVYTVKRRKGKFRRRRLTLRFWSSPCQFFHQRKSQSSAVVTKPITQTPITRFAASSGDIYTVAFSTTARDVSDEHSTDYETIENTVPNTYKNYNPTRSQAFCEQAAKSTMNFKPSTAHTRKLQDTLDTVYMNVTEVPTDSGLGVYHIVPWSTIPAQRETGAGEKCATALSEDDYNDLQFEEDHSKLQNDNVTYYNLKH